MTQLPQPAAPYVGATKEIWDAINVDLQQIVDDISCWEGRHAERMCERLEDAIKRLNAAVGHEREGYETCIALGYALDALKAKVVAYDDRLNAAERCPSGDDYNNLFNLITL